MTEKKVMIVTGEASGDMHGANLIKAMKAIQPDLTVFGMGGAALIGQGMEPLYDATKLSVVGLSEVFGHLRDIVAAQRLLGRKLQTERPGVLILIDLPDFNLMLAAKAKKLSIPVFYYISPQVWAWRRGRIKKIKRLVDRMAVIMPFEKDFYRRHGMDVDFVGHPLLDEVRVGKSREEFLAAHDIRLEGRKIVGLLPGSRRREVATMLPIFLEAAGLMRDKLGPITFLLPVAPTLSEGDLAGCGLEESKLDIRLVRGERYDLMAACDAVMAASGTVTLELAILKVPMVVSYRVSPLTYFLGRRFIKVDYASLINLIADRQVVAELLQEEATPANIDFELTRLLADRRAAAVMKEELAAVVAGLGSPGASRRAAESALELALWE
ncbi:MAG: lipid-A-disaccharide synthase [Desulfurivibrionaceae bacterium]|nr:lipid-A-disaccharide synthase [Desulfobulbales bacterium]MDT8335964.1 lipid-A-disaccharide synthase [Desulfurivibrionaceae bacterium]